MEKINNTDIIIKALTDNREGARRAVYGLTYNISAEAEAMRKFIESRQDWCGERIIESLKELINK